MGAFGLSRNGIVDGLVDSPENNGDENNSNREEVHGSPFPRQALLRDRNSQIGTEDHREEDFSMRPCGRFVDLSHRERGSLAYLRRIGPFFHPVMESKVPHIRRNAAVSVRPW